MLLAAINGPYMKVSIQQAAISQPSSSSSHFTLFSLMKYIAMLVKVMLEIRKFV